MAQTIDPQALPDRRKFLIFGVMAFGQFMALIDIQIVAASLNEVRAGLSASSDEISWVQTAYLMAELVMIPFSAFLAQALSTRWLFTLSAGLFTVASALCGLAWSIESMIAFRALQGFVGGAMVPTVFATGFAMFSGKQRAMIPAILGMVSVLAPTLGPTLGGWITDAAGWRWIFYINILPGAAVATLAFTMIRVDLPNPAMLKRIDWTHLLAMAVFLGGLEYVLEEGPKNDWLQDHAIATGAWLSFVALLLFLERSFRSENPIVNLSPFRKPTFVFACVFNLVIGFGIYAATYLVPVFLGTVRGYNASEIGSTVFIAGIVQMLGVPVAASLSQRLDPRIMITFGLSLFAAGLWLFSFMTPDWGFHALLWPQAVRSFAIMLCIVPSVNLALAGFAGPELRYASGLFNLMRNLGGAIGIALVNTWLQDNARLHMLRLGEALGAAGRSGSALIEGLAQHVGSLTADRAHALQMAQGMAGQLAQREALTLAFNDVFRIMAMLFVAALVLVPLCRPPARG
ncbi:DHA2 family efflux MFS transporter permease subunit [Sphingomonas sp. HITSZ_GF]|uniref:DHA2 family efflux MFS transporter permease subunit n=1 Tax=Sphingomonas sp. HITSZ_GF TaxID=3037247 RepID=UPI00240E68FC|nr:DHA2 family efflux MFS transporter permease subunit [Sphingomonas sp. HITSZ_GF]MDG2534796.1 DHA2 family efflux MFS transporter permease subunit [Sphingomonas sp. HITSZ_GF]